MTGGRRCAIIGPVEPPADPVELPADPMQLPADPVELAAALPDAPRWVELRSLLRSGWAVVHRAAAGDGIVVLDPEVPSGFLVGRPDRALLREALAGAGDGFELIVPAASAEAARGALPGWTAAYATVHAPARPFPAESPADCADVVVSAPPQPHWLALVPEADDLRRYAELAAAIAVRVVDGDVVSLCIAGDVTETLWDVGIDTVDGHRRRGHARATFAALAAHMAAEGRQPVWCAEEGNAASMALAARLGFRPVDRIALLRP